ncbi:MAG: hypothetical protein A2Z74_03630 [Chloroflexi bacterium RBG_13_46_9]|nr:MAG: hypothetical protein A2Z74_03630 [Chloroflexi bacterium RBG_13_46_9]
MMVFTESKLDKLEASVRLLKNASAILFMLITSDQRGQTIYDSLNKVDKLVRELNDQPLLNLYNKLLGVFLSGTPHQQITPDDYFAFIQRLGTLLNQAAVQANEADIAIREAIGFQSVVGVWGGRDWLPQD